MAGVLLRDIALVKRVTARVSCLSNSLSVMAASDLPFSIQC